MQVLMVTNTVAPDALGGLDRYVRDLSAALVTAGADVTVLTKRSQPELPRAEIGEDGVRVHRFDLPPKTDRLYAPRYGLAPWRAVFRHLRLMPDAVVHGHFAIQALPLALSNRPFLFSFQSPVHKEVLDEREFPLPHVLEHATVKTVRAIERRVVTRAARNVVLSRFMRTQLAELSEQAADESLLLPGAVDLDRFRPGPAISHAWMGTARPLLFTARRFVPRTGVQELVRSMPDVLARLPDARLAIAGAGPLEGALRADIARLGLSGSVELLGRISDDDLVSWYSSADLVVMPTQELEGFGLTTAEALACGTPVIGTPAGSVPEVVELLDRRLVTASTAPKDIAERVVSVATDDALVRELSSRARAAVAPHLGWTTVAQTFLGEYERLAARR